MTYLLTVVHMLSNNWERERVKYFSIVVEDNRLFISLLWWLLFPSFFFFFLNSIPVGKQWHLFWNFIHVVSRSFRCKQSIISSLSARRRIHILCIYSVVLCLNSVNAPTLQKKWHWNYYVPTRLDRKYVYVRTKRHNAILKHEQKIYSVNQIKKKNRNQLLIHFIMPYWMTNSRNIFSCSWYK